MRGSKNFNPFSKVLLASTHRCTTTIARLQLLHLGATFGNLPASFSKLLTKIPSSFALGTPTLLHLHLKSRHLPHPEAYCALQISDLPRNRNPAVEAPYCFSGIRLPLPTSLNSTVCVPRIRDGTTDTAIPIVHTNPERNYINSHKMYPYILSVLQE